MKSNNEMTLLKFGLSLLLDFHVLPDFLYRNVDMVDSFFLFFFTL